MLEFLRRLLRRDRNYQPVFTDERFVRDCVKGLPSSHELSLSRGSTAEAGPTAEEDSLAIAHYFRGRTSPKFFADRDVLRTSAQRIASDFPSWKDQNITQVRSILDEGLGIYSKKAPRLRPGFPWGNLEPGAGQDKLYAKRPHRFSFVPRIALAILHGEPAVRQLQELLQDWVQFASSPSNHLAYDSNLAVIQRILALTWGWAFLSAREEEDQESLRLEVIILKILMADIQYLGPRLGSSFPNNHLLADHFAGWFVGLIWPEFIGHEDWVMLYEPKWLRELERQILPDGTSFEHSTHYHEFACEMVGAYIFLKRRNEQEVPSCIVKRAKRIFEFQADLAGPGGHTIKVGDATEDPLFPLDGGDGWGTAAWAELHRGLWRSDIPASLRDNPAVERAFWLLGGTLAGDAETDCRLTALRSYPDGGFFVFPDPNSQSRLVFRTAPGPGRAICAGHMHADLMSIYFSSKAAAILVDTGTYTYRSKSENWKPGEPAWRRYIVAPESHNTLCIEAQDPLGPAAGDFRAAHIEISAEVSKQLAEPSATWVEATLKGDSVYTDYRRGVVQIPGEYWLVYDILPAKISALSCSFGYQFSPAVAMLKRTNHGVWVDCGDLEFAIIGSHGLNGPECLVGSEDPLGGWVSNQYGSVTGALQARFRPKSGESLTAVILDEGGLTTAQTRLHARHAEQDYVCIEVSFDDFTDIIVLRVIPERREIRVANIVFDGDLLWYRYDSHGPLGVRWIHGRSFAAPEAGVDISSEFSVPAFEMSQENGRSKFGESDGDTLKISWPRRNSN